jgi:hypothetical protein
LCLTNSYKTTTINRNDYGIYAAASRQKANLAEKAMADIEKALSTQIENIEALRANLLSL